MIAPLPLVQDIVLVGGGHAHALVLRMWGMNPLPGVRLTLINPGPSAPYTGMLPGLIAGHYRRDEIMVDLVRLARFAGAEIILDRATGIDPEARLIHLDQRPPLAFDIASIDIGISSDLPDLPGYKAFGIAAKPLGGYAEAWVNFLDRAPPNPRITILGGGIGGIELALASHHRLVQGGASPEITVVERGEAILPNIGARARETLQRHLVAAGIKVRTGITATSIGKNQVILSDGSRLTSDFTLAVAGARPQDWLGASNLETVNGFLAVGPTLQTSDPAIFAAGDCTHMTHAPRPKAGVFAVRQAPVLFQNLRAAAMGRPLHRYNPQRDYLKLVSTGGKGAVADKSGLRSGGGWLWRLKDRIDRKFMAKLTEFPAMPAPALPPEAAVGLAQALGPKPLCGGCGAKVGAGLLTGTLAELTAPQRSDVLSGPGDDAAVLRIGQTMQVITTDQLRRFALDTGQMARLAALHALGDIWAMGVAPQAALAQIILPRLSERLQSRTLAQIMAAATKVFAEAGADIIGGHTSIGDELTIGFTVTGLGPRSILKSGARAGDAILLVKPIGTGTIMAAEMALARLPGLILGEAVATALATMSQSQGPAAAILAPHASAMTDVTGFGLAGHLLEVLDASGTAAEVSLSTIPFLPAAISLAAAGHGSSLLPSNLAATSWRMDAPPGPSTTLLSDPQTCGPLLATVPENMAKPLLASLQAAGYQDASRIGTVTSGKPFLTIRD